MVEDLHFAEASGSIFRYPLPCARPGDIEERIFSSTTRTINPFSFAFPEVKEAGMLMRVSDILRRKGKNPAKNRNTLFPLPNYLLKMDRQEIWGGMI